MVHAVPFSIMLQQVNAPKQIDYLSLDVEGAESIVMKSFPWDTHRFSVLTVERPHTDLVGMLRRHHYRFLCLQDAPDPLSGLKGKDEIWVDSASMSHVHAMQIRNSSTPRTRPCAAELFG